MYVQEEARHNPLCVLKYLLEKDYRSVDRVSRTIAYKAYVSFTSSLSETELWRIIDKTTGGLGYTNNDRDLARVIMAGCTIAWPEAVKPGYNVLEIGTGLGRTIYCLLYSTNNIAVTTIDISPSILSIALYRNPYRVFQKILWNNNVHIVNYDAVVAVHILSAKGVLYDHIIHDGGPNPMKNPRLYTKRFLEKLILLLKDNGTISIFAGRNPRIVSKLYQTLKQLGLEVETVSFPYTPVRVFHGKKIYSPKKGDKI